MFPLCDVTGQMWLPLPAGHGRTAIFDAVCPLIYLIVFFISSLCVVYEVVGLSYLLFCRHVEALTYKNLFASSEEP